MNKMRFRIPFVGFVFTLLAFIATLVALGKYINLYTVAGYATNWWTVLYSVLPALFLAVILVNSLLLADDPFFMIIFYVASAFMLIYGALAMLQPCISEIAFVLGSPDLAMGDNAIRVFISDNSIDTTVWYVVAAVFTIIGAFTPNMFMRRDERRFVAVNKAVNSLNAYNRKADKMIKAAAIPVELDGIPFAPERDKNKTLDEQSQDNAVYGLALGDRLKVTAEKTRAAVGRSAVAAPVVEDLDKLVEKSARIMNKAKLGDCANAAPSEVEGVEETAEIADAPTEQPMGEETNNG